MKILDVTKRIDELRGRRVFVLGDLILDRYTWGNAERVSPEAPVLVLRADEHEVRPGGAASVAVLLRHLEASVTLAGVVGADAAGRSLLKILDDEQVDRELVCCVSDRPTTTKERFVGRAANRHPHQILRVDHETREAINAETASRLLDGIARRIAQHNVIIISDYAKGVCTPELLNAVINAAHDYGIAVVVDPARISDYGRYRGASLVTPNREEAELATDTPIESPADALNAGRRLVEQAGIGAAFVTIDRDGIAVVGGAEEESSQHVEPAVTRDVYDITGAGDMVVAVSGLCQAAGWPLGETARLANAAADLEIEQIGIAPVSWLQIEERYFAARDLSGCIAKSASGAASNQYDGPPSPSKPTRDTQINGFGEPSYEPHNTSSRAATDLPAKPRRAACMNDKIATLPQLASRVAEYRTEGKSIVLTNGCFDLLHVGHVAYLEEAAKLGDVLIVAINSDAGVRRLKRPERPVICESERAAMLASLACVEHVLIFDEETPHELLDCLRPDVLAKGGTTPEVVGREVVEGHGGRICITKAIEGISTTRILSHVRDLEFADS